MDTLNKTQWLTRTGALIAALVVWQMMVGSMTGGNQLIVGSGVNLILAIAVMTDGLWSGAAVGMLSPVFARFLGIGPFWVIVPVIAIGNLAFVILWHVIGNMKVGSKPLYSYALAAACAAFVKYLILFLGVSYVAIPLFLDIPEAQANTISAIFGSMQLVTAAIGGAIACVVLPFLRNAMDNKV